VKKRAFGVLLPVLVTALLSTNCCYDMVTEERYVAGEFSAVSLDGVGDVFIHPGREYRVVVSANDDIIDRIQTTVVDNTLYIGQRRNTGWSKRIDIDVYMPTVRSVILNGVGDIRIYTGDTENLDIQLSGVGDIHATNFRASNVNVVHSGTGDIRIWATDTLNARLTGVGDIRYRGNPRVVTNNSGVGRIRQL